MQHLCKLTMVVLLLCTQAKAHEHWLWVAPGPFEVGEEIIVHLQSGHELGASEFLIKSALIQVALAVDAQGEGEPIIFQSEGDEHIAVFRPDKPGEYLIVVKLRKRDKGPYSHFLTTRIQVGSTPSPGQIPVVQPFAIQLNPMAKRLVVLANNDTLKVPIHLLAIGPAPPALIMDRNGSSSLGNVSPGFYVAIAHFRRQVASHAFYLEDSHD